MASVYRIWCTSCLLLANCLFLLFSVETFLVLLPDLVVRSSSTTSNSPILCGDAWGRHCGRMLLDLHGLFSHVHASGDGTLGFHDTQVRFPLKKCFCVSCSVRDDLHGYVTWQICSFAMVCHKVCTRISQSNGETTDLGGNVATGQEVSPYFVFSHHWHFTLLAGWPTGILIRHRVKKQRKQPARKQTLVLQQETREVLESTASPVARPTKLRLEINEAQHVQKAKAKGGEHKVRHRPMPAVMQRGRGGAKKRQSQTASHLVVRSLTSENTNAVVQLEDAATVTVWTQ